MSNARKIVERSSFKERLKALRTRKVKVDLSTLPDAVIDGKLTVPLKGRLYFVRTLAGKTSTHEGYVFSYDEATGDINVWDETRSQFWGFNAVKDSTSVVCKAVPTA